MSVIEFPPKKPLPALKGHLSPISYSIEDYSSYSSSYHPKNVMVDNPTDQYSRWSTTSNSQNQFLTLKLEKVSVLALIAFGKYHKVHVCNLKEFKVYCGLTLDGMTEVLSSGLRNDEETEVFSVAHKLSSAQDVFIPCKYVKIVPVAAWGANFNFSIWFIKIMGITDQAFVDKAMESFTKHKEKQAVSLCLKHFRQRNLLEPFRALSQQSPFTFEHPLLSRLHEELVVKGDFAAVEQLLEHSASLNLFQEHIRECTYRPVWQRIFTRTQPPMRGGHQMCFDVEGQRVLLFGGWDGSKDLADLWMFDVRLSEWKCLSYDTSHEGGPLPRSCHKMCLDQARRHIYVLGGYVDLEQRSSSLVSSDFFRFDLDTLTWAKLSNHTQNEGGPELIYDHQMAIESANEIIYVFGGRTINPNGNPENSYSGLYSYDIKAGEWKLIRSDANQPADSIKLKSRVGHSMLFDESNRCLYIFAGQRLKEYLSDFYVYDIDSDTVIDATRDCSQNGGPEVGFTQRATLDLEYNELYILSGLLREKPFAEETTKNSFWKLDLLNKTWSKVYQNENLDPAYWARMANIEPCPRFAHHMVYDPKNKIHYLFGGNPGDADSPTLRLDDFWKLKLDRPKAGDVLRRVKLLAKHLHFKEMCGTIENSGNALKYLQTEISRCVNHEDEAESKEFRALASFVFQRKTVTKEELFQQRNQVYERILSYFPTNLKEPKTNLVDLV